jgi:hypothetical protein
MYKIKKGKEIKQKGKKKRKKEKKICPEKSDEQSRQTDYYRVGPDI